MSLTSFRAACLWIFFKNLGIGPSNLFTKFNASYNAYNATMQAYKLILITL